MALAVRDAHHKKIILTHGHSDHAESASSLSVVIDSEVWGPAGVELSLIHISEPTTRRGRGVAGVGGEKK